MLILQVLSIKGMAQIETLTAAIGAEQNKLQLLIEEGIAAGDIQKRQHGYSLTPRGKEKANKIFQEEAKPEILSDVYTEFNALNKEFKQLISDWQMRNIDGEQVLNDHSDTEYDNAVLLRLKPIHKKITSIIKEISVHVSRITLYLKRFEHTFSEIQKENYKFLVAPFIDSYHTIWFEFHEDLIRLVGRNRKDEAAAGHAV